MTAKTQIMTHVGRLVSGDAFAKQTRDSEGQVIDKDQWFVAVAFEKGTASWNDLFSKFNQAAVAGWPQFFPNGLVPTATCPAETGCTSPAFAWKIVDGDSQIPNKKGKKPCDKEGYKGHWVVRFSTGFEPRVHSMMSGRREDLTDPNTIKRGYYVRVGGTTQAGTRLSNPSIYVNLNDVVLYGFGTIIASGPDVDEQISESPVADMPAGMSTTPTSDVALPEQQDAPAFSQGPEPQVGPNANGLTYAQMQNFNMTDDELRAKGMIL